MINSSAKSYLPEISFLRGLSIIGVLLIHGMNNVTWAAAGQRFSVNYAMFWNQFSRFCVPFFIFISGLLLLFRHQKSFNYLQFLKKRLGDLFLPYAFWTLLSILSLDNWGPVTAERVWRQILFGQGYYYHLYFITLIFQFYLLAPLFIWGLQAQRRQIFTAICVIFNLAYLGTYQLVYLDVLNLAQPYASFWHQNIQPNFLAWIGYFALGGAVGCNFRYWQAKIRSLPIITTTICFLSALVILLLDYYYSVLVTNDLFSPGENFMRPTVFLYATAALIFFWRIASKINPDSLLHRLGVYSLGVYFAHLLVQNGLVHFSQGAMYQGWWQATAAVLLTLLISWGLTWAVSQLPGGRFLVGNINKQRNLHRSSKVTTA